MFWTGTSRTRPYNRYTKDFLGVIPRLKSPFMMDWTLQTGNELFLQYSLMFKAINYAVSYYSMHADVINMKTANILILSCDKTGKQWPIHLHSQWNKTDTSKLTTKNNHKTGLYRTS